MVIALRKNQTLLDFTTQFAGAVDELFNVAIGNKMSITNDVQPGTMLNVEAVELRVARYFAGSVFDITTLYNTAIRNGGIGFMQIGTNFIVS